MIRAFLHYLMFNAIVCCTDDKLAQLRHLHIKALKFSGVSK